MITTVLIAVAALDFTIPDMRPVEVVEDFNTPALYKCGASSPTAVASGDHFLKVEFQSVGDNTHSWPTGITYNQGWISVKSPPGMMTGSTVSTEPDYIQQFSDGTNTYLYKKLYGNMTVWFEKPSGYSSDGSNQAMKVAMAYTFTGGNPTNQYVFIDGALTRKNCYEAAIDSRKTFGWPNSEGSWSTIQSNAPARAVNFGSATYRGGLFVGQMTGQTRDRSGKGRIQFFPESSISTTNYRAACLTSYCAGYAEETAFAFGEPADPPALDVRSHVGTTESSELSSSTTLQKEGLVTWRNRWAIMSESSVTGEALGAGSTNIATKTINKDSKETFISWPLSKLVSGTLTNPCPELGALLAHNESTYNGNNVWYYFGSREWLTQKSGLSQGPSDGRSRIITCHATISISPSWTAFPFQ